jgi:hypothetical protein
MAMTDTSQLARQLTDISKQPCSVAAVAYRRIHVFGAAAASFVVGVVAIVVTGNWMVALAVGVVFDLATQPLLDRRVVGLSPAHVVQARCSPFVARPVSMLEPVGLGDIEVVSLGDTPAVLRFEGRVFTGTRGSNLLADALRSRQVT